MELIGISGKSRSGKDVVGKIIQYLITDWNYLMTTHRVEKQSFKEYCSHSWNFTNISGWKIVKFADALKDIVCILTGCTKKQLEDRKFKDSYLPDKYIQYIVTLYGNSHTDWADHKDLIYATKEEMEFNSENNDHSTKVLKLTYRDLLIKIGDFLRYQIHPDTLVNALFSRYKREDSSEGGERTASDDGYYSAHIYKRVYPKWIVSDVRRINEVQAIKDRGGINIRVNRNLVIGGSDYGYTHVSVNKAEKDGIIKPQHLSETALDDYKDFDYIIDNNDTIEELIEKVKVILFKENLL